MELTQCPIIKFIYSERKIKIDKENPKGVTPKSLLEFGRKNKISKQYFERSGRKK